MQFSFMVGEKFLEPFCYPKDENKKNSVWDKPRELTKYLQKLMKLFTGKTRTW